MFAGVFPFASTLALISNVFEVRSDLFHLLYVNKVSKFLFYVLSNLMNLKKPRPIPGRTIGVWLGIFKSISYASVLTNSVIFAFTTDQVERIFIGDSAVSMIGGHNATCLFIMLVVEHCGLVIVWLVLQACEKWPKEEKAKIN